MGEPPREAPGALSVEPREDGRAAAIQVRAQPGARRSGLLGTWNGQLRVGLKSPPEGGRANDELVGLLAELLSLRRSQVQLVRGERARSKLIAVALPPAAVLQRLLPLLRRDR